MHWALKLFCYWKRNAIFRISDDTDLSMNCDSMHLSKGRSGSSSSSVVTPSSDFSTSSFERYFFMEGVKSFQLVGSEINIIEKHKWTNIIFSSRSTEDAQWSDPRTPLKTQKDNWSSLVIDSGYAGELPSGGDGSTPYSKWVELFTCPWRSVKLLFVGNYTPWRGAYWYCIFLFWQSVIYETP